MNTLFSDAFRVSLKKHNSIKKSIKKKVDMITKNPIGLGEPLKGALRGYYTCPVRKNFLIIFLCCKLCRLKGDDEIVLCHDCRKWPDDTIKFIDIGPHNQVYKRKK